MIVGTGGIGTALADMLQPFDVRVIGVNRSGKPLRHAERTVTVDQLAEVLAEADFVVVAAALTEATKNLFDDAMFAAMKPEVWLLNVARGGLVDTDALAKALTGGSIAGAALDVTEPEPLPHDHALWGLDNALITPHVANTWDMALPELRAIVRRNVAHFAAGEPLEGPVDPEAGY